MIKYTDIKEARKQLRLLQYTFRNLQLRQEHLRSYIHQYGDKDADVRTEVCDNRLMLGKLQRKIQKLNGNIVRLDREKTMIDKINKASKFIDENIRKKQIYDNLIELKKLSEAFNKMGGYLYSSICADEMNVILEKLKKYQVEVNYYQWIPGRVEFSNLDKLIEQYGEER